MPSDDGSSSSGPVTVLVGSDDAVRDEKPDFDPVTLIVMRWPASALASLYVFAVAPLMMTPSRSHWYFRVTSLGDQLPADAVSVEPTTGEPETVGTGPLMVLLPLKWMNSLG